jgi:hypothetical protein
MYRDNYIEALRTEMLEIVAQQLTPVAVRYGYSDVPLETTIKWRPLVLVLGNYSSGKSTLINDFLGAKIQGTGQAPTDDSFTVLTYDGTTSDQASVQVTETRDGQFLLNSNEFPFEALKKHGQRFASHFRLKKVNSPFLENLAIIDTPGMLDSISERDRGYDYQEVIGDLAQIADLVLVLFDPHKAGTVREAHTSLRETLPARTFEDRVLYVLNRIDECASMIDLLRVYGTLCWNLSQITGRKDIPPIHLTYSPSAAQFRTTECDHVYLQYLENQREELKNAVLQAPRHRLDNVAAFVETHSQRLLHFLEALVNYRRMARKAERHSFIAALVIGLIAGAGVFLLSLMTPPLDTLDTVFKLSAAGATLLIVLALWIASFKRFTFNRFHKKMLSAVDNLTNLSTQTRRDNWALVRSLVENFLRKSGGKFSFKEVRKDFNAISHSHEKATKEFREALKELESIPPDQQAEFLKSRLNPPEQSTD